ncbi:hypothetical protein HJFPF1_06279 [Paramyrothecium foliicola]|nr:hypothetical protein HJFPF1_06279 [Paramyrothecium foliicola]
MATRGSLATKERTPGSGLDRYCCIQYHELLEKDLAQVLLGTTDPEANRIG